MRKSPIALVFLLSILGLVLCACAATTAFAVARLIGRLAGPGAGVALGVPDTQGLTPVPDNTPGAGRAAVPSGPGRVLVQGANGDIYTVLPDGTGRIDLTTDADAAHVYRQPAWSPDGSRIAWVEVIARESVLQSALLTSPVNGGDVARVNLDRYAPFYLAWSPNGGRVAVLSSWDEGLALRMVEVASASTPVSLLGQAQPFYFAWSPDGEVLLAHLDGEHLSVLSVAGGGRRELDRQTGIFPAPQWSSNGESMVFARRTAGGQQLVIADRLGAVQREIADFAGGVSFSLNPNGEQIAYVVTPFELETAAFGTLYLTRLRDGLQEFVEEGPVLAFFWSPDGHRLAFLAPGDPSEMGPQASAAPIASATSDAFWLRWWIWDGDGSHALDRFVPSDTFLLEYLRFFDQYSRGMTPWSPDGRSLVYAGESEEGVPGVWVQAIDGSAPPMRVGDGVYAAWSPM